MFWVVGGKFIYSSIFIFFCCVVILLIENLRYVRGWKEKELDKVEASFWVGGEVYSVVCTGFIFEELDRPKDDVVNWGDRKIIYWDLINVRFTSFLRKVVDGLDVDMVVVKLFAKDGSVLSARIESPVIRRLEREREAEYFIPRFGGVCERMVFELDEG